MTVSTISFIVFLIIGYFLSNIIQLKSTFKILLVSIFAPIILLIITGLLLAKGNPFDAGVIIGQCLISTVSMIILMLVLLLKKSNKKPSNNQ